MLVALKTTQGIRHINPVHVVETVERFDDIKKVDEEGKVVMAADPDTGREHVVYWARPSIEFMLASGNTYIFRGTIKEFEEALKS